MARYKPVGAGLKVVNHLMTRRLNVAASDRPSEGWPMLRADDSNHLLSE